MSLQPFKQAHPRDPQNPNEPQIISLSLTSNTLLSSLWPERTAILPKGLRYGKQAANESRKSQFTNSASTQRNQSVASRFSNNGCRLPKVPHDRGQINCAKNNLSPAKFHCEWSKIADFIPPDIPAVLTLSHPAVPRWSVSFDLGDGFGLVAVYQSACLFLLGQQEEKDHSADSGKQKSKTKHKKIW